MASPLHAALCAIAVLVFWTLLGWPVTRRLLSPTLALPFAPLAGWAMHSVIAVPIFYRVPFSALMIAVVGLVTMAVAWMLSRTGSPQSTALRAQPDTLPEARVSAWAWAGAFVLASLLAVAILPKAVGDSVFLSNQIFDHAKVSIVDDMARLGLPPGNPFLAHDGSDGRLAYYYLWHFSAAEVAKLFDVTGWDAEVAMTFVSALVSLSVMMSVAVQLARRSAASLWVVVIAAAASSRVIFETVASVDTMENWLPAPGGLGGWMFQSVWVPQHLMSTSCVVLSVLLITAPMQRNRLLSIVLLAASITAAFESSTWVGGIVFALVCVAVVPMALLKAERNARVALLLSLCAVLTAALILAEPFLVAQAAASAHRFGGSPVALRPFEVLGLGVPQSVRRFLDIPAFWLLLLPVELPAMYIAGLVTMRRLAAGVDGRAPEPFAQALAATGLIALAIACLLASTLADNNDLAWRATLMGSVTLIIFAAAGVTRWVVKRRWLPFAFAMLGVALGMPESVREVHSNLVGDHEPDGRVFAKAPEMWAAVRRHLAPEDRIASNPYALRDMTPWPVNISWSLLADRRSCYAGWELTQVYSSVPHDKLYLVDEEFKRVFAGTGTEQDVKDLATVYDCSAALVTAEDGAWLNDPFKNSDLYSLVEENPGQWRIYHRIP